METQNIFLPDWLRRSAENRPEHMAVQFEQTHWSFAELDREVQHLARQLATLGVHEGQRVALLAANGLSYVTFLHALTRLGAVLVPLNIRLTFEELCWQVRDVHAELLVHDAEYATLAGQIAHSLQTLPLATLASTVQNDETLIRALPEANVKLRTLIDLSATQAILYTSGTSGYPKGAIITYRIPWWNAVGSALHP